MRFAEGIAAQPESLRASARLVNSEIQQLVAPDAGDLIALVGIGGNWHGAAGAANAWRARGLRAVALNPGELMRSDPFVADVYVMLSESGRSAETLDVLDRIGDARTIAVTNDPASPLARACREQVVLGSGPDSAVYTTGYTATLQALGLLGRHWSGAPVATNDGWGALPERVAELLADVAAIDEAAIALDRAALVDVIGSGVALASSGEGALLLRESARLRTAHHETQNYLHGPMEVLEADVACIIVGNGRETQLAGDVAVLGCPTVHIGHQDVRPGGSSSWAVRLPECDDPLALAVLEIVVIQQLGWSVARHRRLAVNGFRHPQADTKVRR